MPDTPSDLLAEFGETPPENSKTGRKKKEKIPPAELDAMRGELYARIEEMNKRHAVLMVGGRCVIMNEVVDPTFGRPDVTFSSVNDFLNWYGPDLVQVPTENGSKLMSVAAAWMKSPMRRQHAGLVFSPGGDVPGHFNLWRGLAIEPKQGSWTRFNEHIFEVICGSSLPHYDYLIRWMARVVQDPGGARPGVAIVLKGGRGVGKGSFVEQFGAIFGSHFLQVVNSQHFTGRFNQHLKDCLLLFVDEGFWAGDKNSEGLLKALITEPTVRVEPKGKDSFAVRNHLNVIIASNNDWIIPAGFDERRFLVLDVSEVWKQDHAYFSSLREEMENGGREAMLYDLLRIDLTGYNLRSVPQTKGLTEQKILSADSITKFWFSRLLEGTQLRKDDDWTAMVETQLLYDDYVRYARNLGFTRIEDDAQFSRTLRKLCPGLRGPRRIYAVVSGSRTRVRAMEFPKLDECRADFARVIGDDIQWSVGKDDGDVQTIVI